MDAATLRKLVWEDMLCADMRANYFAELVGNYQRWDKWIRVGVLVASSGAVATALSQLDVLFKLVAPILATAGSFWLLMSHYGSLARDAADLHAGWNEISRDYERLWNNLDVQDAETLYYRIYERGDVLSKTGTKFPNKTDRLEHWLDQAARLASVRYA